MLGVVTGHVRDDAILKIPFVLAVEGHGRDSSGNVSVVRRVCVAGCVVGFLLGHRLLDCVDLLLRLGDRWQSCQLGPAFLRSDRMVLAAVVTLADLCPGVLLVVVVALLLVTRG